MEKLRIGMIGCGQIMPATAKGILDSRNCEMKRLMDINHAALAEAAEKFGLPAHTDLFEFLACSDIDAVYIAVPHASHAAIAVEALRAGKHVMIEKPMATTAGDARLIIKESEKAGKTVGVAMTMRFMNSVRKAREFILKGAIGDVISTRVSVVGYKDGAYYTNGVLGMAKRSAWRAFQGMAGGGILIMNAVHNLDAMYYITGLVPARVTALGGTYIAPASVEDMIALLISYKDSNSYGVCEAMSSAFGANHADNYNVIYGTKGILRMNGPELSIYTVAEDMGVPVGKLTNVDAKYDGDDRKLLIEDFAEAVMDGRKPLISAEDGALITGTICAAYRSMANGSPEDVFY